MSRPSPAESSANAPRPLDEHALELAALYALSALGAAESEAVERDYRDRPEFWQEVRSLRDAADGLAEAGPRVAPRRDLWPDIRARIGAAGAAGGGAQVWKQWRGAPEGSREAGAIVPNGGDFEATGFPGVRVRRLSVDEAADRVTMLIRMDAGSSYPAHRHGGVEECLVLEGDLEIGGRDEMRAGDYQRMGEGSVHALQSTRGGCLLFVTSSRSDELLG